MTKQKFGLASAYLNLFNEPYYYNEFDNCFKWDLVTINNATTCFNTIPSINLGRTNEEADNNFKNMIEKFVNFGLSSGTRLDVIFNEQTGEVLTFSIAGTDRWISVKDNFETRYLEDIGITPIKFVTLNLHKLYNILTGGI